MAKTKKYVVINGEKYEKVAKAKPENSPLSQLKDFMKAKGYTVRAVKQEKYTRKNGKSIDVKRVTFTNDCDYLVGTHRFWKAAA